MITNSVDPHELSPEWATWLIQAYAIQQQQQQLQNDTRMI